MDKHVNQGADIDQILETGQLDGLLEAAGCEGVNLILEAFWRSTSELIANLRVHLNSENWGDAARAAHALKGSSANVGAVLLAATAKDIEGHCRTNDVHGARQALENTNTAFVRTKAAFEMHLDTFRRANNC